MWALALDDPATMCAGFLPFGAFLPLETLPPFLNGRPLKGFSSAEPRPPPIIAPRAGCPIIDPIAPPAREPNPEETDPRKSPKKFLPDLLCMLIDIVFLYIHGEKNKNILDFFH